MDRRTLLVTLAGGMLVAPLAADAQQPAGKVFSDWVPPAWSAAQDVRSKRSSEAYWRGDTSTVQTASLNTGPRREAIDELPRLADEHSATQGRGHCGFRGAGGLRPGRNHNGADRLLVGV